MPDDDTPASTKLEDADLQLLPDVPPPTLSFRSKKRNRVMQSCVACHSQKRKCDRKRPCTRCTEHGISGQCVYQLEDPAVSRDRTEQDELLRLRSRVAELEKTVRVLMQKPLSKRQAASLDDAILGATGKRKMLDRDGENDDGEGRDRKLPKSTPSGLPANEDPPEWLPFPDPTQPSPLSATSPAFSPFSNAAVSPADVRFHQSFMSFDRYSPDVPTPPYSAFPTPSSDAGSPFKHPGDTSMNRRFSEGSALAGMMSHASMVSPAAMSAASPAAASPAAPLNFHPPHPHQPHHGHPPPTPTSACGCGMNPIGSEVYSGLQTSLDAAFEVLKSLPDHAQGTPCALILALADLLDNIVMAGQSSAPPMLANTPPQPPPPPMTASSQSSQQQPQQQMVNHNSPYTMDQPSTSSSPAHVHTSPAPDHTLSAPSPHISSNTNAMAPTPASNYHLHNPVQTQNPFQHSQVPTVTGLADLSAWANFDPSSSEIVIGNSFADASNHPTTQYTPAPNMMQQHSHSSNQHHYGTPMIYGQGHP